MPGKVDRFGWADPPDWKDWLPHFPHKCPKCGGPAYVGQVKVDCFQGCYWTGGGFVSEEEYKAAEEKKSVDTKSTT